MAAYEFAVLGSDQTLLARSTIELDSCRAAWAQVTALAWRLGEIPGQIRVTDSNGDLVIVTGVRSVLRATLAPPAAPRLEAAA